MKHRQPRRLGWALLASVLFHASLALSVLLTRPEVSPVSHPASLIEMELVKESPPGPPPARAPPVAPSPKQASKRPANPQRSPTVETAPTTAAVEPPTVGTGLDAPRQSAPFLVPRLGTVLPDLGTGEHSEASGRTLRNGPGEQADPAAVREYTAERAQQRLDQQLGQVVAEAQRRNGLVDPYFTRLQADLIEGFKGVDVKLSKRSPGTVFLEDVVETYTQPAERFAQTGSPLANDEQARSFSESSLGRSLDRGGLPGGDVHGQRLLQGGLQTMAFSTVLKDSASRPRLKTVLMLRQDGDGALAEATVLEKSGDVEFDEFVLHLSRKVFRSQGDTSEKGGAPSALGWSSVWQFTWEPPEVKVKLLRVLKQNPRPPLQ